MILYFSGTGNCLSVARRIASETADKAISLYDAANADLSSEKVIGLVYPSYYFNPPRPVPILLDRLTLPTNAYVFIVIVCGAQTGNSIWAVEQLLRRKGVRVAYCHKLRMPDCSAIGFGRNPNDQTWKFERFASRLDRIISDVKARRHAHHFGAWGPAGWLCALPSVEKRTWPLLLPHVNADKCIGCGVCERVCPQGNISLVLLPKNSSSERNSESNGEVAQIGGKCVECLSCVHFCQQQAIEIAGRPTPKLHQYHNPNVKLKDLLRR